jgi:hypothetical protein
MKTILLYQPWAKLVMIGAQQYVTKSWATNYCGPLLIYAAKRFSKAEKDVCREEPFRSALADVIDGDSSNPLFDAFPLGAIVGMVRLISCRAIGPNLLSELDDRELGFGEYRLGRWAWKLQNPAEFKKPIATKGSHGMWDFPDRNLTRGSQS